MPRFEYLLDDVTTERAEALMARPGPPLARLALLVLRYGRTEEMARRLPEWTALFAQVQASANGQEELLMVVRYLLLVGDQMVRGATGQVLHSLLGTQRTEEVMRSYGEELIEQGLQQGLARGRAEARAEGVVRILAARGVHVDEEARRRILSCSDLDTLDRWFERALRATSLSDVLEDLAQ